MDITEPLRHLDSVHARLTAALDALDATGEAAWDVEPRDMPGWTRRDVVAHIEWWEVSSADVTAALTTGRPLPIDDTEPLDLDALNRRTFEANRGRSAEDVRAGEAAAWLALRGLLAGLTDADLFDPARFAALEGEPLWARVHGDTDDHWAEHLPHLR